MHVLYLPCLFYIAHTIRHCGVWGEFVENWGGLVTQDIFSVMARFSSAFIELSRIVQDSNADEGLRTQSNAT